MDKYYIYLHKRDVDGEIFYIGIGGGNKKEKIGSYKRSYSKDRSKFWKNYTNKYEYKVEILYDNLLLKDALLLETELIKKYGRINLETGTLVNLTDGGEGASKSTWNKYREPWNKGKTYEETFGEEKAEEMKKAMSLVRIGKPSVKANKTYEEIFGGERAEEIKHKLSTSHFGKKSPLFGKSYEELYGEEKAEEMKKALSLKHIGKIAWNKGKIYNEEYKEKLSKSCTTKKKIILDGVEYESITMAAKILNVSRRTICRKLNQ